ncbi:MAG: hypothetical protein FWD11_07375, partial [Micrococcales bacterium]|nr:hypothetical protein [Micrococcales bacterium]
RKAAERLGAQRGRDAAEVVDDASLVDPDYDSWTLARLRRRAAELDVPGRSAMNRAELTAALRERTGSDAEPDAAPEAQPDVEPNAQ